MSSLRALAFRIGLVSAGVPLLVLAILLLADQARTAPAALDRQLLVEAVSARELLAHTPVSELAGELRRLHAELGIRITVVRRDGAVLADSQRDASRMENHARRPEIAEALRAGTGRARRYSATLGEEMLYLAVADTSRPDGRIYRTALPIAVVSAQLRRTQLGLLLALAVAVALSLILSARLAGELARPLEAVAAAAGRFAAGDPEARVLPDGPEAVRRLGATLNAMFERLNEHLRRLDEAQAYLDTVIRQMPEGLLILDSRGAVTRVNEAAETLLEAPAGRLVGRPLLALLMSYALDGEVARALGGEAGSGVEIPLPGGRWLRAAGGPLQIPGRRPAALVLLQDITEVRRTQAMRQDFVANVSHELRTPVTAVRVMVETIVLRGARRPELVEEYGPRILAECERLERLIADLLLLAESESGHLRIDRRRLRPREVAEAALHQAEPLASEGTTLRLGDFEDAEIEADPFLLGQCLRNLVDNALRYAPGSEITLEGTVTGDRMLLAVRDTGPGIPAEELPRIFERFYRVDRARTREVGGSGLGLSLVRHLTESMGGRAWAASEPGQGSVIYLEFPLVSTG